MKRILLGIVIGVMLGAATVSLAIPKDPPRINVPFKRTPCPKEFTVGQCGWWESYQDQEEARWNELIRQINRGNGLTFESIRSVADSVGRIP